MGKTPAPRPCSVRVVYQGLWDRVGRPVFGVSSPGQVGTGYPAQYASVIIFQRLIRGVGGAQEVQTLSQAVTPAFGRCPSLSLRVGLYYELSTPAFGGTWRLALATRDNKIRTTGVGWTREEAVHQASSERSASLSLVCEHIRPPQKAHTKCVHTGPVSVDLSTRTLHTFRD